MNPKHHKWTEAEDNQILSMKAEGKFEHEIAAHFNTTLHAVASRHQRLSEKLKAAGTAKIGYAGTSPSAVAQAGAWRSYQPSAKPERKAPRKSAERKAFEQAAAARNFAAGLLPGSLTATLCNDPPPGRSALDKRLAGIIDEPEPEKGIKGIRPNPITLATRPFVFEGNEA